MTEQDCPVEGCGYEGEYSSLKGHITAKSDPAHDWSELKDQIDPPDDPPQGSDGSGTDDPDDQGDDTPSNQPDTSPSTPSSSGFGSIPLPVSKTTLTIGLGLVLLFSLLYLYTRGDSSESEDVQDDVDDQGVDQDQAGHQGAPESGFDAPPIEEGGQ